MDVINYNFIIIIVSFLDIKIFMWLITQIFIA